MDLEDGAPVHYYLHQARRMKELEKLTMYIDFNHMARFQHADPEFMTHLVQNFNKYENDLREGLKKFMKIFAAGAEGAEISKKSYYTIAIYNLPQITVIRDLRTLNLGRLMSIYGTVTRTTDAKPELILGTFRCRECNNYVQNVE